MVHEQKLEALAPKYFEPTSSFPSLRRRDGHVMTPVVASCLLYLPLDMSLNSQALWSIQLQMDVLLRHRLCAAARQMAVARVSYRSKTDALWHLRAEKQRRLGLDNTIPSHSLPPPISRAGSGTDDAVDKNRSDMASSQELQDLGDGRGAGEGLDTRGDLDVMSGLLDGGNEADRVGTLLVRMGQLEDLGSMGSFAFVPNAVATLLVEESSASLEQMEMETVYTKVRSAPGSHGGRESRK